MKNDAAASPAQRAERGQVLVVVALVLVALLGFAGLAIDGGNLYTEQRRAQSAADNAVMAAALLRMQGEGVTNTLRTAAINNASLNLYNNDGATNWVFFNWPPQTGQYAGNKEYIEVVITQNVPSILIHFVYGRNPIPLTVHAVARAVKGGSALDGPFGIIALTANCNSGPVMEITGGGNSGGILVSGGNMFVNVPGGSNCAIDPPNSANNWGIYAEAPYNIVSVGSNTYAGSQNMGPLPIQTGYNGGVPIDDPFASVPTPTCTGNGSQVGGVWQPGKYGGAGQPSIGTGTLAPGIYCITGQWSWAGSNSVEGTGVTIVMLTDRIRMTGQATLTLSAPTGSNCLGDGTSSSSSCTYAGMVFWSRVCGQEVLTGGGNGATHLTGTVYAPCGIVNAHGGGSNPEEAFVYGQIIAGTVLNNGNGTTRVFYDDSLIFHLPPYISLTE